MKSFLLSSLFLISATTHAQVIFNGLTYFGSGCPAGTVSITTSPDGSSMSIIFDEFKAEVPQYDGNNDNGELPRGQRARTRNSPTVQHKACSLSFSATLPPRTRAHSIDISMDARGATIFDEGIEGSFSARLIGYKGLARSKGNPVVVAKRSFKTSTGPLDESWIESPRSTVPLHSGCSGLDGRDIRFDLKNHINAEITDGNESRRGMIIVDSNDIHGLLKFTLRTTPCGGGRMAPK